MHDLLLWLTASVALHALASNLAWAWRAHPRSWQDRLLRSPWPQLAAVAFYLGLPALALLRKVPGAGLGMGLAVEPGAGLSVMGRLHWAWSLLIVLGLAAGTAGIWAFGRVWHARARGERWTPRGRKLSVSQVLTLTERALLQESHWAFYRAGILASGLVSPDLAVFLSLFVLALEAWSAPSLRMSAARVDSLERFGQDLALATLSATSYLCTGGFLWSYLGQWLALLLLNASGTYRDGSPAEAPPARTAATPSRSLAPIEPTIV